MKGKVLLVSLALLPIAKEMLAQSDGVLIDYVGSTRDASAVLDVRSTDQGVLVPRISIPNLAAAAPVTAPAEGLLVYNTSAVTGVGHYYWDGTGWVRLMSGNTTPLTGSGVTDKVAFWTSGTNLGQNTNFHWDNTNGRLGIGNAAPSQPLHVTGNARVTGNLLIVNTTTITSGRIGRFANGTAAAPAYSFTNSTTTGMFLPVANELSLSTNSVERMRIISNGNIGIGAITAPTELLHIGSLTDAVTANQIVRVESNGFAGIDIYGDRSNDATESGGAFVRLSQDAVAVQGILGVVNVAGRDGSGNTFTGTEGNSVVLGNKYAGALHLGTSNSVRMSIASNGTTRLHTYATNGIVRTTLGNGTLSSTGGGINLTTEVTGVLPVANGGTGSATQNWVDLTTTQTAAGNKTWTGVATFSNATAIRMSNGTAALPALSFTGDPNTGMYWHSADAIGFSTAGVEKMSIASNGDIELTNKVAIRSNDAWLRLNPTNAFTNGIYVANFLRVDGGIASGGVGTSGAGTVRATSFITSDVGFRISNAAANGTYLRGNGTNYVSSAIQAADLPTGSGNYIQNQIAAAQAGAGLWTAGTARADAFGVNNTSNTSGKGLSLYNGPAAGQPDYGMMFAGIGTFGAHAYVNVDWATYLTMNANAGRGWVFKAGTGASGNVASISGGGNMSINGRLRLGNAANTEMYSNGSRILARSEGVDGVAEFASYGMYLPRTGQTYNLYLGGKLKVGHGEAGWIDINDANTRVLEGSGNAVRMQTNSGYIDIGPQNTSWAHIQTDRVRYYFNKGLTVDEGLIGSYDENLSLQTSGTTRMTILTSNGNVGIGTAAPTYNLHVIGRIKSNAINETSDARLKKDVTDLHDPLSKVLAMRGVNYYWRTDEFPDMKFDTTIQFGLIAQELEKVVPELVSTDSDGWKSIEYSHIVPLLIEAIKELKQENNLLHGTLDDLVLKVELLDKEMKKAGPPDKDRLTLNEP
ncbi:MAG: tail fiber domain-containing protein [Flavobacteriales bacterium]|nr:tail fiber domain-containing protein [Flavobacteriales bacterium]